MTKSRAFPTNSCQNISNPVGMTKTRAFPTKSCQSISSPGGMTKTRAFPTKSCQTISSSSVGFTKSRAFFTKSCQTISNSVGFTKTRAFPTKSCQNISSPVGFSKTRAFPTKSCQYWANQLCRNNISLRPKIRFAAFFSSKFLEKFFRRLCHTPDSPALSCFVHEAIMNSANAQYSGEHFLLDESSGGA